MSTLIPIIIILLYLGLCAAFSAYRGEKKARIRALMALACAALAVWLTVLTKNQIATRAFYDNILIPILEKVGNPKVLDWVGRAMGLSATLNQLVFSSAAALMAPLIALFYFIILHFFSWVIYLLVTLLRPAMPPYHTPTAAERGFGALWGIFQGLVTVFLILLPLSAYLEYAAVAGETVLKSEVLESTDAENLEVLMDSTVHPLNQSGVLWVFRKGGGHAVHELVSKLIIDGDRVSLTDELSSITSFGCNIYSLSRRDPGSYSSPESLLFSALAGSFRESALLPTIAVEVVYTATDAWLKDDAVLGLERPAVNPTVDPFFESLLQILNKDSQNKEQLSADITTMSDMVALLAQKGVLADVWASNTNAVLAAMAEPGVISSLIEILGDNPSTTVLIPELTNIGLSAVAYRLGIPADADEKRTALFALIAEEVNYAKALPRDSQPLYLSLMLNDIFLKENISAEKETVNQYAKALIKQFSSLEEETLPEEIQQFFAVTFPESVDTLVSPRLTLSDFLINSSVAAEALAGQDLQAAALKLEAIFTKLAALPTDEEYDGNENDILLSLSDYSTLLGSALDAMSEIKMFRKEKTDRLFVAILQSNQLLTATETGLSAMTAMAEGTVALEGSYEEKFTQIFDIIEAGRELDQEKDFE